MSIDLSTTVLLRRIAQLEATVGRLSEDLGSLRSAISEQGLQLPRTRGVRPRVAQPRSSTADNQHAQATGGLAGATARGEAARVQWVKDGLVVPGEQLAQAWGLTRQALAPAAERGEVFAVKVGNRLYYPNAFLGMDREVVAAICRALGALGATEKLMFWAARARRPRRKKRRRGIEGGDGLVQGGAPGRGVGTRARSLARRCGCLSRFL